MPIEWMTLKSILTTKNKKHYIHGLVNINNQLEKLRKQLNTIKWVNQALTLLDCIFLKINFRNQ